MAKPIYSHAVANLRRYTPNMVSFTKYVKFLCWKNAYKKILRYSKKKVLVFWKLILLGWKYKKIASGHLGISEFYGLVSFSYMLKYPKKMSDSVFFPKIVALCLFLAYEVILFLFEETFTFYAFKKKILTYIFSSISWKHMLHIK